MGQRREKFQRERDPRSDQYERRGGRDRDWSRDRSRGWNGGQSGGMSDMKSSSRPIAGSPGEPRRRPVDYPPHMDMKRRFSPDHDADLRGRKRMRPFNDHYDHPPWGSPPGWNMPARPLYADPRADYAMGGSPAGHPMEGGEGNGNQMMTFKMWLNMQSDDISDEDAITNYNAYKVNFRQQQLQEFFVAHKNEEWFKEKYHPDEADKKFTNQRTSILWRVEVFEKMEKHGIFDRVRLDLENEKEIIKLMDSAVIFMEGGKDEDLKILDMENEEAKSAETDEKKSEGADGDKPKEDAGDSKKKKSRDYSGYDDDEDMSDNSPSDVGGDDVPPGMEQKSDTEEPSQEDGDAKQATEKKLEEGETDGAAKPRALHRTHSIFMRSLPPFITKQEIVNLCKEYEGFVRVAFSLQDQHRFLRRCWVTFNRDVNIKDICWKLNKIRLRDAELNPVVNRDLTRRVRAVSGISQHASCARNDLRNMARLIVHLDSKWKLWEKVPVKSEGEEQQEKETAADEGDKEVKENPWLKNISDYLVDETSAEEEELLGANGEKKNEEREKEEDSVAVAITRDDELIKVLDRLLYYLRIVHSVDYYNASEYFCEDEMPNRCGIVHARGPIPPNMLTKKNIDEFQKRFSQKLALILNFKEKLTDEEAKKLGPKDEKAEIEKFIASNTQELEKDKWLCPLSGKKFKGKEYIRKHIWNKHKEKIDAVRSEVKFFNNYLMDPRRPGPIENQQPQSRGPSQQGSGGPVQIAASPHYAMPMGRGPTGFPGGLPTSLGTNYRGRAQFASPQFQRPPNPYNGGRSYPPRRDARHGGGSDYRSRARIAYHDLDAPDADDLF